MPEFTPIRLYICDFCGHRQPGLDDGFYMCEECGCTELAPLDDLLAIIINLRVQLSQLDRDREAERHKRIDAEVKLAAAIAIIQLCVDSDGAHPEVPPEGSERC